MKKSLISHIVIMVVAAVLGAYLATILMKQQADITVDHERFANSALGGFNKFASDVQWMLFINYCGGQSGVNDQNADEIYRRLNAILANDPTHEMAYSLGGMSLSVAAPTKAADILMRGAYREQLRNNWQIPFSAGFVLDRYVTDEEDPQRLRKAEEMFRLAASRNTEMPYILSALVRTRAKRIAARGTWSGIPVGDSKHAYLCALYDEWRKGGTEDMPGNGDVVFADIRGKILEAAQAAKASDPKNKHVLNTIDRVMKFMVDKQHLCDKCLSIYEAGDKFCSNCGNQVAVYGTCAKCGAVLKGRFCSACGCDNSKK